MTRPSALSALGSPNFALFWSAQVISGFGDKITFFALAFVTWELTRSALFTVFAVVIATVPYALFGFVGGAIADAMGHRRAMVATDLIRAGAISVVPVSLALGAPLAVPYALVFVAALCSAVFSPARMGIVPDLVPASRLGASNSLVYASDRTVEIVGSLIAGVLVAALGTLAFYVDALTFAVSAVLLLRIDLPDPPARSLRPGAILAQASDGIRFLTGSVYLRANTIFSLLAQLCLPVVNGLTPVLIFREYARGPEELGIAEAALAAGAVLAGLAIAPAFGRLRKGRLVIVGFAAYGLNLIALALAPTFEVALVFFAVAGITNVLFFIPNVTISQELAPPALRARVFGARTALLHLTWLPIVVATGLLAEELDVRLLIGIAGAFTIVVALGGTLFRSVRDVP
jgi:MFS family permease